jgi:5'-phosphate synthase pdxT subunit
MRCGVLALQGDWAAHAAVLDSLGVETSLIRTSTELDEVDALVLPGGESTAMLRLMGNDNMAERISERIRDGLPTLATCAGVILLAAQTSPAQPSLALLDVDVERNAYGRQVHSRVADIDLNGALGEPSRYEGVFIRAPKITRVGPDIEVLGRFGPDPVLVRKGRIVAATFHPELTNDHRIHRLLVEKESGHGR